jgi:predicted TIM-barrel fold metal-dependent hydrolase
VAEIKKWADKPWVHGVHVTLPVDFPVDHPDMDPIWQAADDAGLCIVHHSFATGYPGYRDLWDNPFIGRTASHPWAAMRMVAAFMGAGILDRFPNIRLSILESGFGWLPFWGRRMDDQVTYMGYVNEDLQHSIWEYMTGGRFFSSIVLHEGEDMVRMVNELMGDHVLMFGSDYPHAESRFPKSVDIVANWESIGADSMKKLMWDNAAKCFGLD